jgi:exonuclease 3'-5' domain-containing protein 1
LKHVFLFFLYKYFYEVRNDSDALYNLHQVSLAGIYDLQLLELVARVSFQNKRSNRFVNGLKRSIQEYLPQGPGREWAQAKEAGRKLFAPELGGRYEVFEDRPLDPRLVAYCSQDMVLLFQLEDALRRRLGGGQVLVWEDKITAESAERVKVAYSPLFNGTGRHMALAPTGWCK